MSTDPTNQTGPSAMTFNDSKQALTYINRQLEEKVVIEKAKASGMKYVDVGGFPINPDILHLIPLEKAQAASLMLFYKMGKNLKAAVSDPEKLETKQLISELQTAGYTVVLELASGTGIGEAQKLYASDQYKQKVDEKKNLIEESSITYEKELENLSYLKEKIETLPAEDGLNAINVSAIKAGASDVHFEQQEKDCRLRFRIDGVLHDVFMISREVAERIVSQMKYKSGMKLNIKNIPQDGRYRFLVNDRKIDVRVSAIPLEYGESFVCRILDSGKHFSALDDLGFTGRSLQILKSANDLSQGMVLVTGPTGSGKTTSLYVELTAMNTPDVKIVTLEDPIEYHLKGIIQSQINEKGGYTFAEGLRAILRHDPDIVMIGEIRDLETAQVAVQAALTGHVLLSTLHTNSAIETITRMVTIGVSPLMLAPALSILAAQRLVRRLCDKCNVKRAVSEAEVKRFTEIITQIHITQPGLTVEVPAEVSSPKGCEACNVTGYRGQLIISEVLHFDDDLREAVLQNKSPVELLKIARTKGMLTMLEDGVLKVLAGQTTLEEIQRVTNT